MNEVALRRLQIRGWSPFLYVSKCEAGGDLYVCVLDFNFTQRQFTGDSIEEAIRKAVSWVESQGETAKE